jgi:hypothetical protein
MTHNDFKTRWLDKRWQESDQLWYQCVALAKLYAQEVYWVSLGRFGGSALAWRENGLRTFDVWLRQKVANDPNLAPVQWDIIFFDKTKENKYGHVAVVDIADLNEAKVVEQNGGRGSGKWLGTDCIRLRTYNYISPKVLGRYHYTWSAVKKEPAERELARDLGIWNWENGTAAATREDVATMVYRALPRDKL